jgi:hypothetical protein
MWNASGDRGLLQPLREEHRLALKGVRHVNLGGTHEHPAMERIPVLEARLNISVRHIQMNRIRRGPRQQVVNVRFVDSSRVFARDCCWEHRNTLRSDLQPFLGVLRHDGG